MTRFLMFVLSIHAAGCLAGEVNRRAAGPQHRDVPYVKGGHERQKLDLYLPEKAAGPLPVIVWVHGGGWSSGSKEKCAAFSFPNRGFALASINYRLIEHATFPAQIEDCKAAVRWLRANAKTYNLDPDRIAAWGSSAGGHLVALLGTSGDVKQLDVGDHLDLSSRVQAVVDWYGVSDIPLAVAKKDPPGSPLAKLLGGTIKEKLALAKLGSAITHVTKDDPPFLIMHGDEDEVVPLIQSEVLEKALKDAGVEATLLVEKGAGHGSGNMNSTENLQKIETFLKRVLRKK